jgi:hypothetical protein
MHVCEQRTSWFISFSAFTHISTTLLHLPAMSRMQRRSTLTRPAGKAEGQHSV